MHTKLFADRPLAQRLERAEGCANASFIESRARRAPESGAVWIDVEGAYAMFAAPDSPVTQSFGLGMFGEVTAAGLDRIEAFFRERGAPVDHEICPLADKSVWPLIATRGYAPFEFTSVLYLDLKHAPMPPAPDADTIRIRIARPSETEVWAATAARAWLSDNPEMAGVLEPLFRSGFDTAGVFPFIAEQDGQPIATAVLNIQNGVAILAGGSTIPEARRQGAQQALLAARLRYAADAGCAISMMGAEPGSASQRNAERSGFNIAYTRTKWRLPTAGRGSVST